MGDVGLIEIAEGLGLVADSCVQGKDPAVPIIPPEFRDH